MRIRVPTKSRRNRTPWLVAGLAAGLLPAIGALYLVRWLNRRVPVPVRDTPGASLADLHVIVIPEFNLGTGPLVYGLAVNPIIGLGSYLAQLFLRAPVMKALDLYREEAKG